MSIKNNATKMQMIKDAPKLTIDTGKQCDDCDIMEVNFEDLRILATKQF